MSCQMKEATEHPQIQRLLMLANVATLEAAAEHFQIPEAISATTTS